MSSKVLETAYREVVKTQFNFKNENTLEVTDAFIFWTNFSGTDTKFKSDVRSFNLAITPEMAEDLSSKGWRIREKTVYQEVDDKGNVIAEQALQFINIKVNFRSTYPPVIKLFTEYRGKKSSRCLDESTVGELDGIDIETCDLTIRCYSNPQYPGKVTGYLKQLYAIQNKEAVYGGKYDDWMEDDIEPELVESELLL